MIPPAKFDNVQYYLISGQFSFVGDLVITHGVLYFFSHTDLEAQRIKNSRRHSGGGLVGGLVTDAIYAGVDAAAMAAKGSYLSKHGLWHEGDTDEQFRQKADTHIVELKEQRKKERFSESLPIPTRIATDEIRNLKMGMMGVLSFEAQYDKHDFNIGWGRKKLLREALWERGFGKV